MMFFSFWSCKKDENKTIATSGTPGSLKASVSSVVLDKSMLTSPVITFSMGAADFGYPAGISNSLQFDRKGAGFSAPKEVSVEALTTNKSFNGLDFNNLLLSLNLSPQNASDIEVRVKSSISKDKAPVYSNTVILNVKPFPLTAWIYVPGAYQGWNILNADSLISETGNGVYTGVIAFTPGNLEFKLTPAKKWDVSYGDGKNGTLSLTGGNLNALTPGSKQLNVDLNAKTWSLTPLAWSVIGDATPGNWFGDSDLKYINDGKGIWTTTLNLVPGQFKFRKNHDWGTNYGGSGGKLALNGANISVATAGSYTITFDLTGNSYTLTKN